MNLSRAEVRTVLGTRSGSSGRKPLAVIAALAVLVAGAGCSSGDERTSGGEDRADASDASSSVPSTGGEDQPAPDQEVTMVADPPGFERVNGDGFSIGAPTGFERSDEVSSNGEPMLVLIGPSQVPGFEQRVVVVRDVDPAQDAAEQARALESAKGAGGPAGEVARVQVEAPSGQQAWWVTWTEASVNGDVSEKVRYEQLLWQAQEDLIVNVVVYAPVSEFADSPVATALRSFVLDEPAPFPDGAPPVTD